MFKFLHTSDWHLGQNFYGYDRSEEQRDFLAQLADIVRKHTPDALLVSGDIFHTAAPSNAAVNLYVEGMLNIHKACPTMAIIVIAGNHDSASRLDSDKRLWELAGVTVMGTVARDKNGKADIGSHIIKVGDKGIVAAVPFAYPSSFPVPAGMDDIEREQRQKTYFQSLLEQANHKNADQLPVVLMAHLAVSNSDFTGHDRDMKMECVDITALGTGYDYAALGHIHRPQNVSEPLRTLPANEPVDFETALQRLKDFNPNEHSYIRLNVKVEQYLPNGAQEQAAQAVADKQCRFCEIKKTATVAITRNATQMTIEEFNKKTPLDIANQYFIDTYGHPMNDEQQDMFNHIYQLIQEENRQ